MAVVFRKRCTLASTIYAVTDSHFHVHLYRPKKPDPIGDLDLNGRSVYKSTVSVVIVYERFGGIQSGSHIHLKFKNHVDRSRRRQHLAPRGSTRRKHDLS